MVEQQHLSFVARGQQSLCCREVGTQGCERDQSLIRWWSLSCDACPETRRGERMVLRESVQWLAVLFVALRCVALRENGRLTESGLAARVRGKAWPGLYLTGRVP